MPSTRQLTLHQMRHEGGPPKLRPPLRHRIRKRASSSRLRRGFWHLMTAPRGANSAQTLLTQAAPPFGSVCAPSGAATYGCYAAPVRRCKGARSCVIRPVTEIHGPARCCRGSISTPANVQGRRPITIILFASTSGRPHSRHHACVSSSGECARPHVLALSVVLPRGGSPLTGSNFAPRRVPAKNGSAYWEK